MTITLLQYNLKLNLVIFTTSQCSSLILFIWTYTVSYRNALDRLHVHFNTILFCNIAAHLPPLQNNKKAYAYPINGSSFMAANANLYKAADNCVLEERHRAPSFQFVPGQSYLRQFFFGWYRLRLSLYSPFSCFFIFFWVRTSRWNRWRWRRAATNNSFDVIFTLAVVVYLAIRVISVIIVIVIIIVIRVNIFGFQSFLLLLLSFFLRSLLL